MVSFGFCTGGALGKALAAPSESELMSIRVYAHAEEMRLGYSRRPKFGSEASAKLKEKHQKMPIVGYSVSPSRLNPQCLIPTIPITV